MMDRSGDTVRKLAAGTGTSPGLRPFEALIARWEMNNEPPPPVSLIADTSADSVQSPTSGATSRYVLSVTFRKVIKVDPCFRNSSMQRQTSQPGWTPRRELEEESYFNTSDDEEDDERDATKDLINWQALPVSAGGPSPDILKSPSIVSSRRRRAAAAAEGDEKSGGRVWFTDQSSRSETLFDGPKVPLVQYGADGAGSDDEAEAEPKQGAVDTDPLAGGFIKEDATADLPSADDDDANSRGIAGKKRSVLDVGHKPNVTLESFRQDIATPPHSSGPPDEDGAPPFLPSLGSLKRKKEEEDDDDGELGLLAKKRAPSGAGSPPSSRKSNGPATTSTSTTTTAAPSTPAPTPKLGGFKIALGGLKSKFGQGGKGSDAGGATKPGS